MNLINHLLEDMAKIRKLSDNTPRIFANKELEQFFHPVKGDQLELPLTNYWQEAAIIVPYPKLSIHFKYENLNQLKFDFTFLD